MSDAVAQAIIAETARRGYSRGDTIACLATGIQESSLNEAAVSANGQWVGVYQQDASYPHRGTTQGNINGFLDKLDAKRASPGASKDVWLNIFWLQQRPGEPSADAAYANGRQEYLTEIKSRTGQATQLYDRLAGTPVTDPNRPDFNEYANWSDNSQDRGGTPVDLFLLHTQEGDGNADSLAKYLISTEGGPNPVSYHYTISQDYRDQGVTVVDVVDTDDACWAVMNSNNRSINLCFAGSRASWSREQWMAQSRAIDVAAYLAAQDCKKYGIPLRVLKPPYAAPGGVADHKYCTKFLKDGNTHTDVGGPNGPPYTGFPWDFFETAFLKYVGQHATPPEFVYPSTDEMIKQIWEQLFGYQAQGFAALFGKTADGSRGKYPVEALADLHRDLIQ